MRFAWAASTLAQALYALRLWRVGKNDWWLAYVACGVIRAFVLWPFEGDAYWWAWILTQPVEMIGQFAAVWQMAERAEDPSYIPVSISSALFASALLVVATPVNGPWMRTASELLFAFSTFGSAAVATAAEIGGAPLTSGVLPYLYLDVLRAIGQHFAHGRGEFAMLNSFYLWASVGVLAHATVTVKIPKRMTINHG
jgi:hypothetical protein